MAYVAENKKFNTNYGKIKNNNSRNTIERNNVALFNFSISEVTLEDGGLTVVCDTITGDTIEYSLDLDGDKCEFTEEMYNYTVGGSIEIFLALVWKLYLSTLDDEGVQQDTETYEQLRDIIAELTKDKEDLTKANSDLTTANESLSGQVETLGGQVETLTSQLEAAQSQGGSGSVDTNLAVSSIDIDDIVFDATLSAAVSNDTIAGGQVKLLVDDSTLVGYSTISSDYVTAINAMVEISDLKINDTSITITQSEVTRSTGAVSGKVTWIVNFSTSGTVSALANNTISLKFKNKGTDYARTIEGTFTIEGTMIGSITTVTGSGE